MGLEIAVQFDEVINGGNVMTDEEIDDYEDYFYKDINSQKFIC